jgi:phospholipid/cholesterol/gamma-HCH transport system substrate-binding protein
MYPLVVAVVAIGAGGAATAGLGNDYTVSVVVPSATNLFEGGSVREEGYDAGSIDDIEVMNGKAKLTLSMDDEFAPVHDGARARVDWKATLGERVLTIVDGKSSNAAIPSGGMIQGKMAEPVEVDKVLSALDPPTRQRLNSLIHDLQGTLNGRERDTNATLRTAGPALQAIGTVLRGVGTDGEAIKGLVNQLNATMGILGSRNADVEQIVNALGNTTEAAVGQRAQLGQVLQRTPHTLDQANATLRDVPGMVGKAAPLLDDLRPGAQRLPSVAHNLRPVLTDMRPAMAQLRPTLNSASELLRYTPGLLDSGTSTMPGISQMLKELGPAMRFLRPYTPELAGWVSNWGSATANYDANGNLGRIFVQTGGEAGNVNPGITTPGVTKNPTPRPGELAGTDAYGGGMR